MLEADTFILETDLMGNLLTIALKDLKNWKIYAKKYTKEDIGKDINARMDLKDIYWGCLVIRESSRCG